MKIKVFVYYLLRTGIFNEDILPSGAVAAVNKSFALPLVLDSETNIS